MQKDSSNHVGFSYNGGEIKAIVKDSSAARYAVALCVTMLHVHVLVPSLFVAMSCVF